jgi:hypothetical protein
MSAFTDLKDALEALASAASDEARRMLATLRETLEESATAIRAAIKAANDVIETALTPCEPDSEGMLDGEKIAEAIQALGGAHSGLSGPLDDLDSTADSLDSAADDVISALEDEDPRPLQAPLAVGQGKYTLDRGINQLLCVTRLTHT